MAELGQGEAQSEGPGLAEPWAGGLGCWRRRGATTPPLHQVCLLTLGLPFPRDWGPHWEDQPWEDQSTAHPARARPLHGVLRPLHTVLLEGQYLFLVVLVDGGTESPGNRGQQALACATDARQNCGRQHLLIQTCPEPILRAAELLDFGCDPATPRCWAATLHPMGPAVCLPGRQGAGA